MIPTRPEVTFYKLARVCLTDRSGGANVGVGGKRETRIIRLPKHILSLVITLARLQTTYDMYISRYIYIYNA